MNKDSGISTNTARKLGFTSGAPLEMGAIPTTGQALALVGGVITGLDVTGSDAGLTSLAASDAGAGLAYPSAANTWTRLTIAADQGFYSTSTSAIAQYSLTSFGRAVGGYADEAAFKAGVNLEANTDFYAPSGTDVAVADGGTGASTDLAARTNLGGSLGRVPLVHPATVAPTVNADSSAGYSAGDLWNDTTGNLTYIADSVAVGAADWRALLSPSGARGYISSGVPYMVATAVHAGVVVDVGAPVAATATADPSGFLATMSGADLTVPTGAHSASSLQSAGQYWSWSLSSLGVTPPSGVFRARVRVQVTGFTDGSRAGIQHVAVGLGTGPTTLAKALGFSRPSSGTAIGYSGTSTSGTPANATGADTTQEIRGSILCGATTSVGFGAERYSAASAIESVNDLTAGAGLAASPTTVTLYAHRQTASSTSDWVLLGLTWSVAWAGL